MYNLIKMDLYRLFHSTSTYVMIVLAACLACFSIFMTNLDINMMKDNPTSAIESTDASSDEIVVGIFVDTKPQWASGDMDASEMLGIQLSSRIALILVSIFVTLFIVAERKNGYIKNFAGQFPNRCIMVAARTVAVAVQVFILIAAYAVFTVINGLIFWGDRFVLNSVADFLALLGVQYLLHFAFACFTAFLYLLLNSSTLSMVIVILLCNGFGAFIYNLIDHAARKSFFIEKYMLETNISSVGVDGLSDGAARAVLVGIIFTLATTALSVLIVQKRDIK